MRTRKKKISKKQQQVNDAILRQAHADLWRELNKESEEKQLMDDMSSYIAYRLSGQRHRPIEDRKVVFDYSNRNDGCVHKHSIVYGGSRKTTLMEKEPGLVGSLINIFKWIVYGK